VDRNAGWIFGRELAVIFFGPALVQLGNGGTQAALILLPRIVQFGNRRAWAAQAVLFCAGFAHTLFARALESADDAPRFLRA
jgi:hypothetical protein